MKTTYGDTCQNTASQLISPEEKRAFALPANPRFWQCLMILCNQVIDSYTTY